MHIESRLSSGALFNKFFLSVSDVTSGPRDRAPSPHGEAGVMGRIRERFPERGAPWSEAAAVVVTAATAKATQ